MPHKTGVMCKECRRREKETKEAANRETKRLGLRGPLKCCIRLETFGKEEEKERERERERERETCDSARVPSDAGVCMCRWLLPSVTVDLKIIGDIN